MRLLVVEGNKKETWIDREKLGGMPYHKRFQYMLKMLAPNAKVALAFPADSDIGLPTVDQLKTYDGVLWTGSSLYVNDLSPAVTRQLDFAANVFSSGVPFYGSCWGLQIAAVVAGGAVGTCAKGREIGISKPVKLTEDGLKHPYFQNRKEEFNTLCIHLDEVVKLPPNSVVLARNEHSDIQALTIKYKNSEFFGVQYHPEFLVSDVAFLTRAMAKKLVEEGLFESVEMVDDFVKGLEKAENIPLDISNYSLHMQEVKRWLDVAVKTK